ncbi:Prkg1 [Symbiodinium microadriaticum]|nr:Prkg1 [Symbiodinium microadriaticum]
MPFLRMQQSLPQFAVAGHFPTTLEVTFQVATPGADQVWIDTLSGGSPMDFASVQCTMAVDGGADAGSSPELFGQISCFPGGQIETETSDNRVTQQAQLRAEFVSTFLPDQRYTLKLELVRMGFLAGPVVAAVATSTASSSADASDFSQAFLLDRSSLEDQGDEQLYLAGQLVLQAPGSGSFVSLSATAQFGTSLFLAADRVHYLTLGFALQAALPKGGRLVLYPAAGIGVAADVVLGLAATNVRMSTALKDIGGADDVFQNSQRLSLPSPSYTARLDVLFQASGEVNESLIALPAEQPLSIQLRVQTRFVAAGSGWLLLTALREDWSVDRQSVTNTNLEVLGQNTCIPPARFNGPNRSWSHCRVGQHGIMRAIALIVLWHTSRILSSAWLTDENWQEETAGKVLLVRFGSACHCTDDAPVDWTALILQYSGHSRLLVTDVNCRLARDICGLLNVTSFPAIMYGSAYGLRQYDGSVSELSDFAQVLSATCSPERPDLCATDLQRRLHELAGSTLEDLDSQLKDNKEKQDVVTNDLRSAMAKLQADFESARAHLSPTELPPLLEKLRSQYDALEAEWASRHAAAAEERLMMQKVRHMRRPGVTPLPRQEL